ncbi:MAG: hypothetical protein ACFFB4_03340 [Promethearchaeota archaeon]
MKNIFMEIQSSLHKNCILSLYGKSGTGKTSFTLYFVGYLITRCKPYQDQCVWIQASEFFPSRRLVQLFKEDIEILRYIRNNIFITPSKHPFLSYQEQSRYLSEIEGRTFPPELKYIVIDNISHHLRFEVSRYPSISEKVKLLNSFYESQLLPLVLFCQINNINLILIHEVSYHPSLERTVPFFYKLYSRIEKKKKKKKISSS